LFDVEQILAPDIRARLETEGPVEWSRRVCESFAGGSVLSRVLGDNFESYLPEDLLVKADRCSMGHSLELRSPFLDTALIEYVARLPATLLRRGRPTTWLLGD